MKICEDDLEHFSDQPFPPRTLLKADSDLVGLGWTLESIYLKQGSVPCVIQLRKLFGTFFTHWYFYVKKPL